MPLALVTGTANGLGYELTAGLIERGWTVAGVDFNAAKQQELAEKWGEKYLPLVGDISDEEFVNSAVAKAHELGHIDLLINNAGQPSFKAPTNISMTHKKDLLHVPDTPHALHFPQYSRNPSVRRVWIAAKPRPGSVPAAPPLSSRAPARPGDARRAPGCWPPSG